MTASRAGEILARFEGQRLLVVGDAMLDRYIFGTVERISPEAPVPILHAREASARAGGAGNTAQNAVGLGASVRLLTVLGADAVGEELAGLIRNGNVEPFVVRDASRPTVEKMRFLKQGHQLLRVDREDGRPLSSDIESDVLERAEQALPGVSAIIVSDYAKGTITPLLGRTLVERARSASIPLAADVKPANARSLRGATLMSPNLREARSLVAVQSREHDSPEAIATEVAGIFDTDVYLTLAAEGIYVHCRSGECGLVPQVHARDVADVSGAGDTAIAVITLALLSGATPLEAAELANAAAAVVVAKIGAVGLTCDELLSAHAVKVKEHQP